MVLLTSSYADVLVSLISGGLAVALTALVTAIYHAGRDAERFRDADRRLERIERHLGYWNHDDDL